MATLQECVCFRDWTRLLIFLSYPRCCRELNRGISTPFSENVLKVHSDVSYSYLKLIVTSSCLYMKSGSEQDCCLWGLQSYCSNHIATSAGFLELLIFGINFFFDKLFFSFARCRFFEKIFLQLDWLDWWSIENRFQKQIKLVRASIKIVPGYILVLNFEI